jgi:hypothetical protein
MGTDGRITDAIRPKLAPDRSDRALAEWARGQHGILTVGQLRALGLGPRGARHRAATGRLIRLHHGVYAIGRPTVEGRWMAAVLACGPGAVLSHRSAAALWGIGDDPATTDVAVPGRTGRSRPGIAIHRVETLEAADITSRSGISCTALARTLVDLAAVTRRRALERAVDRAEELRVFDLGTLHEALERHRGRRGTRALAAILTDYSEPAVTSSEAEERLLALIDSAGIPRPRLNAWIALDGGTGYAPDFLWDAARLIVEVDGRAYHARRRAFSHDRQRDRKLALAGFETRRYAASELRSDPERVIAEIRAFLSPRRG